MKRILCVLLALILSLSCCVCAFASYSSDDVFNKADQEFPFILIRGMDLQGVRVDVGTENERPAMGKITAGGVMGTIAKATVKGLFSGSICTLIKNGLKIFTALLFGKLCKRLNDIVHRICRNVRAVDGNNIG